MGAEYVLEMKNITKRYGETTVLSDVSLSVRPGEIHALLGENGAGKSTLMNVLFGMPVIHSTGGFDGEMLIDGEKAAILSPNDAMNKGIGMVHQEFMLLPGFTITENIKLNREITRPTVLSRALHLKNLENLDMPAMCADARKALDSVGMSLDENTLVKGLPVGYMQFVEIAREIDKKGIRLLVFDEPTAVLTESEAETLISVMKQIAQSGIAIIFITHRLDEVIAAADNITILRDGKLAATRKTQETSLVELAELMIGRKGEAVVQATPKAPQPDAKIALSIKNLIVDMPGEEVKGVDLEVREGEILGVGGLAGQGKIGIPNEMCIRDRNFFHFMVDLDGGPCVKKRVKGCGAGNEYVAVTPEGDIYPCHQFVGRPGYKMGSVLTGEFDRQMQRRFAANSVLSKEKCSQCWARFFCGGGCAANAEAFNKDISKPYDMECELEKKRLECALAICAIEKLGAQG